MFHINRKIVGVRTSLGSAQGNEVQFIIVRIAFNIHALARAIDRWRSRLALAVRSDVGLNGSWAVARKKEGGREGTKKQLPILRHRLGLSRLKCKGPRTLTLRQEQAPTARA